MLSNLVITPQRLVIIIDELGHEKISKTFLTQLIKEQGEEDYIKILPTDAQLENSSTLQKFITECGSLKLVEGKKKWNVILPNLSDFLTYQKPSEIFSLINQLKRNELVKRSFLWISTKHILNAHTQYLLAAFEYMADLVLNLQSSNELSILTRKPGGGVTNNRYTYTRTKTELMVQMKKDDQKAKGHKEEEESIKIESLGTFKIELDEDEMVARNAMKMPYEKGLEATESNIIYTPDAADDFDEEDPDEDLDF